MTSELHLPEGRKQTAFTDSFFWGGVKCTKMAILAELHSLSQCYNVMYSVVCTKQLIPLLHQHGMGFVKVCALYFEPFLCMLSAVHCSYFCILFSAYLIFVFSFDLAITVLSTHL